MDSLKTPGVPGSVTSVLVLVVLHGKNRVSVTSPKAYSRAAKGQIPVLVNQLVVTLGWHDKGKDAPVCVRERGRTTCGLVS